MHKLMVIFHSSADAADLEREWSDRFVAKAERMPGLRRVSVSRVTGRLVERTQINLIHEFYFDDEMALHDALASPEGQAAGRALMQFAGQDTTLLMAEHREEARGGSQAGNAAVGSGSTEPHDNG